MIFKQPFNWRAQIKEEIEKYERSQKQLKDAALFVLWFYKQIKRWRIGPIMHLLEAPGTGPFLKMAIFNLAVIFQNISNYRDKQQLKNVGLSAEKLNEMINWSKEE